MRTLRGLEEVHLGELVGDIYARGGTFKVSVERTALINPSLTEIVMRRLKHIRFSVSVGSTSVGVDMSPGHARDIAAALTDAADRAEAVPDLDRTDEEDVTR